MVKIKGVPPGTDEQDQARQRGTPGGSRLEKGARGLLERGAGCVKGVCTNHRPSLLLDHQLGGMAWVRMAPGLFRIPWVYTCYVLRLVQAIWIHWSVSDSYGSREPGCSEGSPLIQK